MTQDSNTGGQDMPSASALRAREAALANKKQSESMLERHAQPFARPAALTLTVIHASIPLLAEYLHLPPQGQAVYYVPETDEAFAERVRKAWIVYMNDNIPHLPSRQSHKEFLRECLRVCWGMNRGSVGSCQKTLTEQHPELYQALDRVPGQA